MAASYYSYEIKENSIDNGFKKITNYETRKYDSYNMRKPRVEAKTFVLPSRYESDNNKMILRKQRTTNKVGTGFEMKMPSRNWFESRFDQADRGKLLKRKTRSVESPAYSVDSGGQASSSIAGEIAKILHIKQGYYADVYNRLDRPGMTTRKPVDVIEDTMKVAVQQAWSKKRQHN